MTAGSILAGKRIVITRPRAQAGALAEKLAAHGAEPILLPMIEIGPMDDYGPLDAALSQLDQYQWIVFTSANAVAVFWARLAGPLPASVRLAAVGPGTARAMEARGAAGALIPEEYLAESLAAAIGAVAGQHVLLPHAELADEVLADILRSRGATADEIPVYRTLPAALNEAGLAEVRRGVDVLAFTSASAARNFAGLVGVALPGVRRPVVACIGPITAQAARQVGLGADVVAEEHTLDGLVAALVDYFATS